MAKEYRCTFCDFSTKIKQQYFKHNGSNKHNTNITMKAIICQYCQTYVDKNKENDHYSMCANKRIVDSVITIKETQITQNIENKHSEKYLKLKQKNLKLKSEILENEEKYKTLVSNNATEVNNLKDKYFNMVEVNNTKLNELISSHQIEVKEYEKNKNHLLDMHQKEFKEMEKKLNEQISLHQKELKEMEKKINELTSSHQIEIKEQISSHQKELKEMEKKINELTSSHQVELKEYEKKLNAHKVEITKLEKKHNNACNYQIKKFDEERKKFNSERNNYIEKIDQLKNEQVKLAKESANKQIELSKESINKQEILINKATEKDAQIMSTVMQTCKNITEKSVDGYINALKYANTQFKDAPNLKETSNFDYIDDNEDYMDDLIYNYHNDNLPKYIGDLILIVYKKEYPQDQSLWNTDASRLMYIIKQQFGKNSLWEKDVSAMKVDNLIVMPIINWFIENVNDLKKSTLKFINKNEGSKQYKIISKVNKKRDKFKELILIKDSLKNPKLSKNIIKYITPHLNIGNHLAIVNKR
jgi:DNA repair protein SbcC/Rad50